jgi:hypothetical protein
MMNPPTSGPSKSTAGPSVQLTTDAVVAAYIHEISDRHRRVGQAAEKPSVPRASDGAPASRLPVAD